MKILAIGDLVGDKGYQKLRKILPELKKENQIDYTIVNGENVAGGMGITQKHLDGILTAGADVITMGNHTWGKKDIFNFIDCPQLIRPANYSKGVPGKGYG